MMNDEDQAIEYDQVLEASLYSQLHEDIRSNIKSALVLSLKIDISDRVSFEPLGDRSTIKEKTLFKENLAKRILSNSHKIFWKNHDAISGHKVKIK
jgi:hypothetical protein